EPALPQRFIDDKHSDGVQRRRPVDRPYRVVAYPVQTIRSSHVECAARVRRRVTDGGAAHTSGHAKIRVHNRFERSVETKNSREIADSRPVVQKNVIGGATRIASSQSCTDKKLSFVRR